MTRQKALTVIVLVSIVFLFATAIVVDARPFGHNFQNRAMGSELPGLRTFLELGLSDSQQTDMINIINKYRDQGKSLRNSVLMEKKNIRTVLQADKFNEEEVRKAFRKSSEVREEMFMLKLKMMAELKAVLNPEQLTLLKERKSHRMKKFKRCFDPLLENEGE